MSGRVRIVHRDALADGYMELNDGIVTTRKYKVLGRTPEGHYVVEDPVVEDPEEDT